MTIGPAPLCFDCRHLNRERDGRSILAPRLQLTCAAFPAGILDAIWFDAKDNTKPYPGDPGIQFEPAERNMNSASP